MDERDESLLRPRSIRLYFCPLCGGQILSYRLCGEPRSLVVTCPFLYECARCAWGCHELDLFGPRGVRFAF